MSWPFKKVLIIGATSGIGEALAARCVKAGSNVIVSGRRTDKLEEFIHRHGKDKCSAFQFDITELAKIPSFAANITKTHPDLDCVLLNSGIQRGADFTKPESVNISSIQTEFTTNYLSYISLTKAFLPFFQAKDDRSALVYVSSSLSLVPILRCPNYCASKAALHHFVLVLREQLKDSNVKIIEIFPPAVQTELHDEKHQPDIQNGRLIGMPLNEFTDEAVSGLENGLEEIPVGEAKQPYDAIEPQRQAAFHGIIERMKGTGPN
ncbi:hypothetical protein MMC31_008165 [Peltigera leucophlebia]|nr:hypothetical protein [Peltigera leucophlebia]